MSNRLVCGCCEHEQNWEGVGAPEINGPNISFSPPSSGKQQPKPNALWNPRYLKAYPLSVTPQHQTLRVRRRTLHGHRSSPSPQRHDPPRRRSRHARCDARRTAPSPIPSGRRRHRRAFARLCPSCDGELYLGRPYIFVRPFAGDEHPQGMPTPSFPSLMLPNHEPELFGHF
jgi:hypothetical protein